MGDVRGHGSVQGVVAQHLFDAGKFLGRSRLRVLLGGLRGLSLRFEFDLFFHVRTSNGFLELRREGLAGAVQLAADGVGGLFSESAHLLIT